MLFYLCLGAVCACTLAYEVVLTRILSVVTWYYLVFVSVSMGMFGMTVGALAVQLRSQAFAPEVVPRRMAQAAAGFALSLPLSLLTILSVPVLAQFDVTAAFGFVILSGAIATPFFFSGVVTCLALTRSPYPVARTYAADLLGATFGCFLALLLLTVTDPASAVLVLSAAGLLAAAGYARQTRSRTSRLVLGAAAMLAAALVNGRTSVGIHTIWAKERPDPQDGVAEIWNPIARVRARAPNEQAFLWGPSDITPAITRQTVGLDIDNDAYSPITRFDGTREAVDFLRWDVTAFAAELRAGGEAAIIGVGGGRDVLNAFRNGYTRTVGIEVNPGMVSMATERFGEFSGLTRVPNLSIHVDEGRSWLSRSSDRFDFIQASMVDTWAATNAGALSLTENGLYTVDGWRVFCSRLKPGGVLAFSRWVTNDAAELHRLFALAWATLLAEGSPDPSLQLVALRGGDVVTLALSNRPFTPADLARVEAIVAERQFSVTARPGWMSRDPMLRAITSARTPAELRLACAQSDFDIHPPDDTSPFFFHTVRVRSLVAKLAHPEVLHSRVGSLRAMVVLLLFLAAALALVTVTVLWPLRTALTAARGSALRRGAAYFLALGFGFMAMEMGMMQQLSLLLGPPVLSLAVVLAGLLLASGLGSLLSGTWFLRPSWTARLPAIASAILAVTWAMVALRVVHGWADGHLPVRVAVALAAVALPGLAMGMCFPIGVRVLGDAGREDALPWLWALNGAASVLATFVAVLIAMETTLTTVVLIGATCYLVAALVLPVRRTA